ncbi:MAG: zinc ribbon domain-containing protein [Chloroflexi bacterium]|nr:zinc ribbon domain-containing protein [Chloroflexota bacterium]
MPLYEYVCTGCRARFERLRPMSQVQEAATCFDCGAKAQRIVSVFAAFSSGASGEAQPIAGAGGGCAGCAGGSCAACGH